jgi:uncharacterized protein RhaS with RHS repeats
VIDPNDNVSRYDYDLKQRLVRVSRMGKVREEYVFDGGDHLVAKKTRAAQSSSRTRSIPRATSSRRASS